MTMNSTKSIPFGYEQTIPGDAMIARIAQHVPVGSTVLEIGVGSGKLAEYLVRCRRCTSFVGIDIQSLPECGPDGSKLPEEIALIQADGCVYDTGEQFDVVIVSFAAESIYKPWIRQLKAKGMLLIPCKGENGVCALHVYQKQENGDCRGVLTLHNALAYANFTNEVH